MRVGNSYKEKEVTSESIALKAGVQVDESLRQSLTDADNGIFRPGALPQISAASAAGSKQILNSSGKARCGGDIKRIDSHTALKISNGDL